MDASFTILGDPASKANSRRIVFSAGRVRSIKSKKALDYSQVFIAQCPKLHTLLTGDLRVTITIHYATRRSDLDESLILDLMQGMIYENDRAVKEKHIFGRLDRKNPRAEILVEEIEAAI